jgi:hypothetical protein
MAMQRDEYLRIVLALFLAILGVVSFVGVFLVSALAWRVVLLILAAPLLVMGYLLAERFFQRKRLARFLSITGGVLAVLAALAAISGGTTEPEATLESCLNDIDRTRDGAVAEIDRLYCETQHANIWNPDPPTMLIDNKLLAVENFDRLAYAVLGNSEPDFLNETASDGETENVGAKLTYIYERWPKYRERPFLVMGAVTGKHQLSSSDGRADWVFQLGTNRDASKVVYVRLMRTPDWDPEPAEECSVALAEVVPIARGNVPSADGRSPLDVIYGLGTRFECLSFNQNDIKDMYKSMTPEERRAFEEGASKD